MTIKTLRMLKVGTHVVFHRPRHRCHMDKGRVAEEMHASFGVIPVRLILWDDGEYTLEGASQLRYVRLDKS